MNPRRRRLCGLQTLALLRLRRAALLSVLAVQLAAFPAASQQEPDLLHLMGMPYQFEGAFEASAEWWSGYYVPQNSETTGDRVRVRTTGTFRLLPELVGMLGPMGIMGDANNRFDYYSSGQGFCKLVRPDNLALIGLVKGRWGISGGFGAQLSSGEPQRTRKTCPQAGGLRGSRELPATLNQHWSALMMWVASDARLEFYGHFDSIVAKPACRTRLHAAAFRLPTRGTVDLAAHIDNRLTHVQIGDVAGDRAPKRGCTQHRLDLAVLEWQAYHLGPTFGNGVCSYVDPRTAVVKVAIPAQIYVAKNYKPGTCLYRAVLEHEQRHVALLRKTTEEYVARLSRAVGAAGFPTEEQQWWDESEKAFASRLNKLIERVQPEIHAWYEAEIDRLNKAPCGRTLQHPPPESGAGSWRA